jgi:hypothetical protein
VRKNIPKTFILHLGKCIKREKAIANLRKTQTKPFKIELGNY